MDRINARGEVVDDGPPYRPLGEDYQTPRPMEPDDIVSGTITVKIMGYRYHRYAMISKAILDITNRVSPGVRREGSNISVTLEPLTLHTK